MEHTDDFYYCPYCRVHGNVNQDDAFDVPTLKNYKMRSSK